MGEKWEWVGGGGRAGEEKVVEEGKRKPSIYRATTSCLALGSTINICPKYISENHPQCVIIWYVSQHGLCNKYHRLGG